MRGVENSHKLKITDERAAKRIHNPALPPTFPDGASVKSALICVHRSAEQSPVARLRDRVLTLGCAGVRLRAAVPNSSGAFSAWRSHSRATHTSRREESRQLCSGSFASVHLV